MKEKIKIKLRIKKNLVKGPCFRIYCNDKELVEQLNFQADTYEEEFVVELPPGSNELIIEHFGKHPKDTTDEMDVAVHLIDISFNGIKCDPVDLHENYFYTSAWPYKIEEKMKNNLYFGFNGKFHYKFSSPAATYVLQQKKKYLKNLEDVENFEVTEDDFIGRLEKYIESQSH